MTKHIEIFNLYLLELIKDGQVLKEPELLNIQTICLSLTNTDLQKYPRKARCRNQSNTSYSAVYILRSLQDPIDGT